jgi:hypothetical protein
MTEISQNIQRLKSIKAECRQDIKRLNILARNCIQLIRTKLDLLQLDTGEDVTSLDIESVYEEVKQLHSLSIDIKSKKDKMNIVEKELKEIGNELRIEN